MIRSPLQGILERPLRALLTVVGGGLLLGAALIVLLASQVASVSIERWTERFEPAVLLEPDANSEERRDLKETIRGWAAVEGVKMLSPSENLEQAKDRLGSESFKRLELDAELFPTVLVVDVGGLGSGDVEFASRLQALETHASVDSVVYPSPQPARWGGWVRDARWGAWALLALSIGLVLWQTTVLLWEIQAAETHERQLLERFGAKPGQFRRSLLLRGLAVGVGIGGVGASLTWVTFWSLEGTLQPLFGGLAPIGAFGGRAVWLLALGPAVGVGAAILATRRDTPGASEGSSTHPGLESVLTEE
jgi:cell division protein FtsX